MSRLRIRNWHFRMFWMCSSGFPGFFSLIVSTSGAAQSLSMSVSSWRREKKSPGSFKIYLVYPGSERHHNSSCVPTAAWIPSSWIPWRSWVNLGGMWSWGWHRPGCPCPPQCPCKSNPFSTGSAPRAAPSIPSRGALINIPRLMTPRWN